MILIISGHFQITLLVVLQVQLEKEHSFIIKKQIPLLSIIPISLMVLAQDSSETEPVMSLDYDASQVWYGTKWYDPTQRISPDCNL